MGIVVLVGGRYVDIQEFCFKAAKRSNMDCAELQRVLFAVFQEWHFQAATRLNKSSIILEEGRFADAQQSCFQSAKSSEMCSAVP